jgi:hypothetical protein
MGMTTKTNQSFGSLNVIERDVIASFKCFSASTYDSQFSGCRRFFRDFANQEIPLQGLGREVRRVPLLSLGGPVYAPDYSSRKLNRVLLLGHYLCSVSPRKRMSRCDISLGSLARSHFKSFRKTTPPFITNFTRSISVMSVSGSPETATISANLPFST